MAVNIWISDDIFARYEAFWRSPEYQAMWRANKTNRASSTGGSLHTGGSITYPATAKKMAIELGRPPTQSEVFVRTHTKKKDQGQYVDTRSEQFVVKRLEDERDARIAAGLPPGPPIDEDEAEQHRREMEYRKQRYETDVTRLQTTIDTQSAEFDQWKSHVSQMYAFMQTMQGTTSDIMPPPPPPPSSSLRPPRPPPAAAPSRTETDPDDGSSSNDEDDYE
ncbi:hypothetical protein PIB30_068467 [Stylosanthes scabra]|uniref:Uncharacterized protein n=1 Tax=Stylosanthes scabra TaxID=79078 RepID=A0ABU6XKR0_9FABA|nr:hypothetical protein [Stylosanthes scabra]